MQTNGHVYCICLQILILWSNLQLCVLVYGGFSHFYLRIVGICGQNILQQLVNHFLWVCILFASSLLWSLHHCKSCYQLISLKLVQVQAILFLLLTVRWIMKEIQVASSWQMHLFCIFPNMLVNYELSKNVESFIKIY